MAGAAANRRSTAAAGRPHPHTTTSSALVLVNVLPARAERSPGRPAINGHQHADACPPDDGRPLSSSPAAAAQRQADGARPREGGGAADREQREPAGDVLEAAARAGQEGVRARRAVRRRRRHDRLLRQGMERILDRYERYLVCEGGDVMEAYTEEPLQGNTSYDHNRLRSRIEALQKSQRNLMGEQLHSVTLKEVQQLEHQIDRALRNIRSRKEKLLMERNSNLGKDKAALETSLHTKNSTASSTVVAPLPNLNICADDSDEPGTAAAAAATSLLWWMPGR